LLEQTNHLNKIDVFPVPDGDTGTNLSMTISFPREPGHVARSYNRASRIGQITRKPLSSLIFQSMAGILLTPPATTAEE